MKKNFKEINKKIASFIVVSVVAATPFIANAFKTSANADIGPIDRYAGPVDIDSRQDVSFIPKIPNVKRYAGPVDPNREITKQEVKKQKKTKNFNRKFWVNNEQIMARYAGPANIRPNKPDTEPMVRYAGPEMVDEEQ